MKKKVLSVVLASALFAGGAVAASAQVWGDWDSSSKSGDNNDITALAFTAESYTIRNGADPKNMLEVITAYAGNDKIVQEPDLEWEISENSLVFDLNTEDNKADVSAYENSGSATITVTANDGKVKASCKVVAAPLIKATGFKFENASYTLPAGTYWNGSDMEDWTARTKDRDVKLVATPNDAAVSSSQKASFADMDVVLVATRDLELPSGKARAVDVKVAGATGDTIDANTVLAVASLKKDETSVYTFPAAQLAKVYAGVTNARLYVVAKGSLKVGDEYKSSEDYAKVAFAAYDPDKTGKTITRDVRASTEMIRLAERAGRTGAITIEVGQTATLGDYVKYGPSNCNTDNGVNTPWVIDYYNANYTDDDFAVLNGDGKKVMGVAVGRVKAVTTFTKPDGSTMEVEVPINVVARGANSKPETPDEPTTENATLAIGGTYWVESGDANTTWTVDNDNVTIQPEVGAGCKVFAKKAGTATVTGKVGDKVVKTVTITIEAAGATTPDVPAEANPSTGDSLLAFLF